VSLKEGRLSSTVDLTQTAPPKSKQRLFAANSNALGNATKSIDKISKTISITESRTQTEPITENLNLTLPEPEIKKEHPYRDICLKFLEAGERVCLHFYGPHSFSTAEFWLHQAEIYFSIYEYSKSESSIQKALSIFTTSSKYTKSIQACSVVMGKSMIELGKANRNRKLFEEGIDTLERAAE
jgi:hypothetical protein